MDDDFGADADFLAALAASDSNRRVATSSGVPRPQPPPFQKTPAQKLQQPSPQKIQQPVPQRLDRAPPSNSSGSKIVQPTPQALPSRSSGSTILVSTRQKGNPVLACLKSLPWEYSDIPADYVLGLTTCALFLSLKYHRLHPEYIYTRIRNLQGKYNLRVLLTLVDIPNHEDSLRELSKTSLVNNVTVILCWSAAEAARYLELYKSYEHAGFAAIRGQQATGYAERLVEFVTVPRSVNKADAVALVSTFGSLRNAINADPEQVAVISGWGEKKVKSWRKVVEEPFRVKKAARRRAESASTAGNTAHSALEKAVPIGRVPRKDMGELPASRTSGVGGGKSVLGSPAVQARRAQFHIYDPDEDDEDDAVAAASAEKISRSSRDDQLSDGVAAALARLRDKG